MWPLLPPPHVVTVFFVLQVPAGKGFVHATGIHNSSNQDSGVRPVPFGPPLHAEGLTGHQAEARPKKVFEPIRGQPDCSFFSSAFIALNRRGNCSLASKGLHAQQARSQAAVGHNVSSQSPVSIASEADAMQKSHIPSMFPADGSSKPMKRLHHSQGAASAILIHLPLSSNRASTTPTCKCQIRLLAPSSYTMIFPIFWMACLVESTALALLLMEKYFWKLKEWKEGKTQPSQETGIEFRSSSYQDCAICLERYHGHHSLKVLSCSHAFHSTCIDRWHLSQSWRKTCPLCMQNVRLVALLQARRLWEEKARGQAIVNK
ncbi:E3 ubiquitin-protein ligase RNF167-like [Sphaerodactylus townsendi]|uniref:E3 ubiquitin-protein ligase RNF167-like n=1 Tax=Sphaerodactylus townsendi TaxID=933632 RepID=UPI0020272CA7|nr:E3 ubiquitin-protein ligase RNF167-like [Sphaerodactylus townsendi]